MFGPSIVPRTTPVKRLFLTFKQKKVHMAIVVNEYGKVLGLVTMDDVLAQIFGALRDERAALQQKQRRGRGRRTPSSGVHVPVARDSMDSITNPGAAPPGDAERVPARPEDTNPTSKVILDEGELTPLAIDVDGLRMTGNRDGGDGS